MWMSYTFANKVSKKNIYIYIYLSFLLIVNFESKLDCVWCNRLSMSQVRLQSCKTN